MQDLTGLHSLASCHTVCTAYTYIYLTWYCSTISQILGFQRGGASASKTKARFEGEGTASEIQKAQLHFRPREPDSISVQPK